ncbi:hypothetical protein NDU88_010840 [Pleurodeles waltl]|uniref:Uncharacterized protein n=1 Tax=Pleurodeles waltl TaxID=8319 RepID=A0AAV7S051_PLEWA|nr:hypothetical protein NDU88_010840 [Pleurodeles waltl]
MSLSSLPRAIGFGLISLDNLSQAVCFFFLHAVAAGVFVLEPSQKLSTSLGLLITFFQPLAVIIVRHPSSPSLRPSYYNKWPLIAEVYWVSAETENISYSTAGRTKEAVSGDNRPGRSSYRPPAKRRQLCWKDASIHCTPGTSSDVHTVNGNTWVSAEEHALSRSIERCRGPRGRRRAGTRVSWGSRVLVYGV